MSQRHCSVLTSKNRSSLMDSYQETLSIHFTAQEMTGIRPEPLCFRHFGSRTWIRGGQV